MTKSATAASVTIPLGFSVPGGEPVTIPIGHMAVVGQTQAAGKTTTLEACAWRVPADYTVLAFVTKRGEGGFTGSGLGRAQPYFRERADWEYVSSILEATLRERMKFVRSWIMRACKGAKSLADVHRNVKALMGTAKGLSADIYYQLDHYLDKIVPQVQGLGSARPLTLSRGTPNVMDLSLYTVEMQALIIASCLETAYKSFHKTIIVVPEAWEFLPRQRKSPVTYAAELYVRKGGALKNYLWIDSQDLAGVHTPVLKQVGIWLLGVQREINEVKRTLAHIHGVKKPKVDAVAGLGLGQFIACFGQTAVTTYVQPVWSSETQAQLVARGALPPVPPMPLRPSVKAIITNIEPPAGYEDPMDAQLKADNDRLIKENANLRHRVEELERKLTKPIPVPVARDVTEPPSANVPFTSSLNGIDWPAIRAQILADDQILAKIAAIRPELQIELTPKVFAYDGSSARGRLARMIANGLFDEPIKPGVAIAEFKRTGGEIHPARLSDYLGEFVSMGFLVRTSEKEYQKSAGLTVTTKELVAL